MVGFDGETKLGQVKAGYDDFPGLTEMELKKREKRRSSRALFDYGRKGLYSCTYARAKNLVTRTSCCRQLNAGSLRGTVARLECLVGGHTQRSSRNREVLSGRNVCESRRSKAPDGFFLL